ncbi:MAG TPA: prolyl aminopeptidase [Gammaproteobacteria bacterium]|nr:prolyl aminopeptidase [Gammaproteobacteria bacterium]
MRSLYPAIQPYVRHTLEVGPPHQLYAEECGNPQGIPVLFLHGGPGGGCQASHRRFFNADLYRIILFDQRGCGCSTPRAELRENTTADLLADVELIRERLGIERWLVFGGSWGSTLGLLYAEAFPERVLGLVLRGIFLCRRRDIQWFYQDGASRLFPDYWQDFLAPVAEDRRGDLVQAYYELLTGEDEVARLAAARAWSIWEGRTSTLHCKPELVEHFGNSHVALSMARIECHYFVHDAFIEPDQILQRAERLRGIPGVIVHGRYDVVCPVDQAFALHRAWPEARLNIIPGVGHSIADPAIVDALVRATDAFAERLA